MSSNSLFRQHKVGDDKLRPGLEFLVVPDELFLRHPQGLECVFLTHFYLFRVMNMMQVDKADMIGRRAS